MRGNRGRDAAPERRLRSVLHARGHRFRVALPIRAEGDRPIRPDIVFPGAKLAVFVDGCFWHGCPDHGAQPRGNSAYWAAKLRRNRRRDLRDGQRLEGTGWRALRFWEHDDPDEAAAAIECALAAPALDDHAAERQESPTPDATV